MRLLTLEDWGEQSMYTVRKRVGCIKKNLTGKARGRGALRR